MELSKRARGVFRILVSRLSRAFLARLLFIRFSGGLRAPAPFTLSEFDPAGVLPDKVYTQDELQTFIIYCRKKCQTTIENLTDEKAFQICKFGRREFSFAELLLYNMRHVQEHAAQLNLILGQRGISVTGWVGKAKK